MLDVRCYGAGRQIPAQCQLLPASLGTSKVMGPGVDHSRCFPCLGGSAIHPSAPTPLIAIGDATKIPPTGRESDSICPACGEMTSPAPIHGCSSAIALRLASVIRKPSILSESHCVTVVAVASPATACGPCGLGGASEYWRPFQAPGGEHVFAVVGASLGGLREMQRETPRRQFRQVPDELPGGPSHPRRANACSPPPSSAFSAPYRDCLRLLQVLLRTQREFWCRLLQRGHADQIALPLPRRKG
jgi:hypothetical protein